MFQFQFSYKLISNDISEVFKYAIGNWVQVHLMKKKKNYVCFGYSRAGLPFLKKRTNSSLRFYSTTSYNTTILDSGSQNYRFGAVQDFEIIQLHILELCIKAKNVYSDLVKALILSDILSFLST